MRENNIEKILLMLGCMRNFPGEEDGLDAMVRNLDCPELSAEELEYVSAATKKDEGNVKHEN